jgi:hypothetical protein
VRHVWREPGTSGSSVTYSWSVTPGAQYTIDFNGYYTGGHTMNVYCENTSTPVLFEMGLNASADESHQAICTPMDNTLTVIFNHPSTGNNSHYLYIDYLNIALATTTGDDISLPDGTTVRVERSITWGDMAVSISISIVILLLIVISMTGFIVFYLRDKE